MDVNDLKSLTAEVNKRMHAATEHVRHELAGVRRARRGDGVGAFSRRAWWLSN